MKSPIALLSSLLQDYSRLNPGVKGLDRDLVTIENRFENEGLSFLTVTLLALDSALVRGLSSGKFTCPPHFKCMRGGAIPRFLSGMLCEIFEPRTGNLKESPDMGILKDVHTLLSLFKKTRLSLRDEELLHQKAVDEFYQCDESASQVVIPDRHNHLIGRVCTMILNNLNHKDAENVTFKHGPGAVSEGYRSNQKWDALYFAIRDDGGLPEWTSLPDFREDGGLSTQFALTSSVSNDGRTAGDAGSSFRHSGSTSPDCEQRLACAKLISVLKNSTSRRTITIEPMLKQFVQQGLRTTLLESISSCAILRKSIALSHQEYNQKLALEGSLNDNWATIDLKSASDLLSLKLVESVFRHHPIFLGWMMDCRTPEVKEASKPNLVLGKFAGMGNALTFPVQSVCFAVVCIAAILDSWGRSPDYWLVRRASRHVRIYGDDIIVSTEHAHHVVSWLQEVGLRVNIKKSFLSGNFKESCGVEAFRGVDITPLYLKNHPDNISESPSVCAGFVELSNHMWKEGLYSASTWLQECVEAHLRRRLPLVSRNSGSLGWHCRLDTVEPHKWCKRTHQFLTKTVALTSVKRRDKLDGYGALLKCLNQLERVDLRIPEWKRRLYPSDRSVDHLESTTIRHKTRIVQRWVPSLTRDGKILN